MNDRAHSLLRLYLRSTASARNEFCEATTLAKVEGKSKQSWRESVGSRHRPGVGGGTIGRLCSVDGT